MIKLSLKWTYLSCPRVSNSHFRSVSLWKLSRSSLLTRKPTFTCETKVNSYCRNLKSVQISRDWLDVQKSFELTNMFWLGFNTVISVSDTRSCGVSSSPSVETMKKGSGDSSRNTRGVSVWLDITALQTFQDSVRIWRKYWDKEPTNPCVVNDRVVQWNHLPDHLSQGHLLRSCTA